MRNVLLLVVLPVLMAASLGAVLRQDSRRLLRVWGVGLPVALLAGVAGVQVVSWGLAATDQMCQVVGGGSTQLAAGFSGVIVSTLTSGEPQFVQIVIAGLIIAGTVLVWLELIVRSAAIYVAVFFMPLALVGYIWPATVHMARRAVEILVALILSKFVIVATLTLGLAAVDQGSPSDGAVAGGAILLMAGFAPFGLLRLAPIVETAAIGHLEGMSRRPIRAASATATTAASAPAHPVARFIMSANRSNASPPAPATVSAVPIPERRPDFPIAAPSDGGAKDG